jgi:phosphate transport system substrate-binding protein
MKPLPTKLLIMFVVLAMLVSACASQTPVPTSAPIVDNPAPAATTAPQATSAAQQPAASNPIVPASGTVMLPEVDPAEVDGAIIAAGSSTVYPLTERMADRFEDEGFSGQITISSIGSGAGFERFCVQGETDISNASRAIKDSEVESCRAIGREPIEFRVGTDALAIVVSQENDFIEDLTLEELAKLFSNEVTLWSEVNPAWPAETIRRFAPGTDSGTFDFFIEEVMEVVYGDEGKTFFLEADNLQLSEDDNVLVQGVLGSPYAIGYFGFAYYQENTGTLNALSVNGVAPTADTAESGDYPLARPLFIYSDASILQEKPQVAAFINFYLTFVNEEVLDVGYFPASGAALDVARTNWLEAMGAELPAQPSASASLVGLPEVDPAEVDGAIIAAGSSTVYPLTERMADRFEDEGFSGQITISSIGSGAGFERFCVQGETDISNASRAIKDSEVESCRAIGREPIEFRVGTDALAIVVSQENDFIEDLTLEELAKLFSNEVTLWSEVNPAWPAETIRRFAPGTDSGTFDFFIEEVMEVVYGDEGKTFFLEADNLQLSEDDNVLVQGVLGSPYAIGYFGFAYYQENTGTLNALSVNGVAPTADTAESGDYPLARPLFIYSDASILQEKPQVAAFINFYLTYVNEEVLDVGYFPASEAALNTARNNWLEAMP